MNRCDVHKIEASSGTIMTRCIYCDEPIMLNFLSEEDIRHIEEKERKRREVRR